MNKLSLFVVLSSVLFIGKFANAEDSEVAGKLSQMLSTSFGAEVSAEIKDGKCRVKYPETVIEEQVTEQKESPDDPDTVELGYKTVTTTLPSTNADCEQTDNFKTYSQYHISVTSPDKLKAQAYNWLKMAFVKNIEMKVFSEDENIVPELGLIASRHIRVEDASYTQTDETTGLKSEIGNLKSYELSQQLTENGENIKFELHSNLSTFNLALPFFSLQIPTQSQQSEMIYKISPEDTFDYADMVKNIKYLQSAETSAAGNNLKIGVDIFGVGGTLDTKIINKTTRTDKDTFQTFGSTSFKNISIAGDFIEKEKQPKSIELTYSLENVSAEAFTELSALAVNNLDASANDTDDSEDVEQKKETTDDDSGYQVAKILNKIAEKANLIVDWDLKFSASSFSNKCGLKRKNGYLSGVCKISVKNLFGVFPQLKQCANNPKADEIPECQGDYMLSVFKDVIDTNKNDSETVYKFTEQGIFKNDAKVGEPVELDFEKMYREKQAQDEARQKQLEQMIRESENQSQTALGAE